MGSKREVPVPALECVILPNLFGYQLLPWTQHAVGSEDAELTLQHLTEVGTELRALILDICVRKQSWGRNTTKHCESHFPGMILEVLSHGAGDSDFPLVLRDLVSRISDDLSVVFAKITRTILTSGESRARLTISTAGLLRFCRFSYGFTLSTIFCLLRSTTIRYSKVHPVISKCRRPATCIDKSACIRNHSYQPILE